jgi:hypothetical protein
MATIVEALDQVFTQIGTEFKLDRATMGSLLSLTTTTKVSLVMAINEINAKVTSAGAQIDDTAPHTTSVYSSTKTDSQITNAIAQVKSDILGGAGPTVDTLKEIADLLASSDTSDATAMAAITTALANRVRFDAAQTLTSGQMAQANANIGSVALVDFGDPAHNYKAVFQAALT